MADEVKFKITTLADTSGFKQTSQGLDDLSQKTKDYIKRLEEEKGQIKEETNARDESRRAVRELGQELPILGELGRLALSPIVGGFVLLASAVRGAWDAIKDLGNRSTPEMQGLTDAIKEQKAAWEELEEEAQAYERTLARITAATETVTAKSKAALAGIEDKGKNELDSADKTHSQSTAQLEEAEKLGLITHQEFLAKKLALDEAYEKKKQAIEKNLGVAREAEGFREYQNLYTESNALEAGLAAKRAAESQAAGAAKLTAAKGKTDEENLKAAEDKLKELETEAAELHEKTTGLGAFTTMTPQIVLEQQKKQNDTETAAQQAIADRLRRKIAQDEAAKSKTTNAANAAKEDVGADEARLKADRERMHELELQLPRDDAKRISDDQHRAETAATESQTRAAKFVSELGPDALDQAGKGAEAMQKGQAVDAGTKALVQSLTSLLGTTHSNIQEVLALIKDGHGNQEAQAREIAALRTAIAQIGGRPQTGGMTPP